MIKQVFYQDVTSGAAHDITTIVSAPKWATKRKGTPASFKFTVVDDVGINWAEGSIICFLADGKGYFYGYVFRVGQKMGGTRTITAYDQTRYLKNTDTYVFEGTRADQILTEIAEDYGLKLGEVENTGYVIPSMCEDGSTLFDIILKALDYTIVNIGRMYYLWDDYGALRISSVAGSKLDLFFGDNSMVTDYSHETEIDTNTYNRIKLVRDNKDTGHRDVYMFQDSNTISQWGILQKFEKVDEKLNASQISERGDNLLELHNKPKRSFGIDGPSDLSVRAGCMIFVQIEAVGSGQFFVVEEATHDIEKATMALKVVVA
ncbi:MAG: hypothetical protein ACK5JF_02830 [Oscillospiraceae bacterium]